MLLEQQYGHSIYDDTKKQRYQTMIEDVKELKSKGKNVIIVSSGAIALGCKKLNLNKKILN